MINKLKEVIKSNENIMVTNHMKHGVFNSTVIEGQYAVIIDLYGKDFNHEISIEASVEVIVNEQLEVIKVICTSGKGARKYNKQLKEKALEVFNALMQELNAEVKEESKKEEITPVQKTMVSQVGTETTLSKNVSIKSESNNNIIPLYKSSYIYKEQAENELSLVEAEINQKRLNRECIKSLVDFYNRLKEHAQTLRTQEELFLSNMHNSEPLISPNLQYFSNTKIKTICPCCDYSWLTDTELVPLDNKDILNLEQHGKLFVLCEGCTEADSYHPLANVWY